MAFEVAESRVPIAVGDILISMTDFIAAGEDPVHKGIRYAVQILYDTGEIIIKQGDLQPHLTSGQITALVDFMNDLRVMAEAQFLP